MKSLESKPCIICGKPVTPTRRKDRNAFWYPRRCEACKGKPRNEALRRQRISKGTSGKHNPRYRPIDSRRLHNSGHGCVYWMIKVADPDVWMFEHRFVMEQMLGRKLTREELVHHKDENGLNNSRSNLQLTSTAPHNKNHFTIFTWSRNYSSCRRCGSSEIPHLALGLCKSCHAWVRHHADLNVWR